MATVVRHGPAPDFGLPLQPDGAYHVTVTGHYTTQDGVAAAGVTEVAWHSQRPAKRQAELLSLRSAFVGWFLETWLAHGGTWAQGVQALREYPYPKVRAALANHEDPVVRKWARMPTAAERARMAKRERRETPRPA